MIQRIRSLLEYKGLPELMDAFLQHAVEESGAEKGVLVVLQDFLLEEKRLTYVRLSENDQEATGGYVYCSVLPHEREGSPGSSGM